MSSEVKLRNSFMNAIIIQIFFALKIILFKMKFFTIKLPIVRKYGMCL